MRIERSRIWKPFGVMASFVALGSLLACAPQHPTARKDAAKKDESLASAAEANQAGDFLEAERLFAAAEAKHGDERSPERVKLILQRAVNSSSLGRLNLADQALRRAYADIWISSVADTDPMFECDHRIRNAARATDGRPKALTREELALSPNGPEESLRFSEPTLAADYYRSCALHLANKATHPQAPKLTGPEASQNGTDDNSDDKAYEDSLVNIGNAALQSEILYEKVIGHYDPQLLDRKDRRSIQERLVRGDRNAAFSGLLTDARDFVGLRKESLVALFHIADLYDIRAQAESAMGPAHDAKAAELARSGERLMELIGMDDQKKGMVRLRETKARIALAAGERSAAIDELHKVASARPEQERGDASGTASSGTTNSKFGVAALALAGGYHAHARPDAAEHAFNVAFPIVKEAIETGKPGLPAATIMPYVDFLFERLPQESGHSAIRKAKPSDHDAWDTFNRIVQALQLISATTPKQMYRSQTATSGANNTVVGINDLKDVLLRDEAVWVIAIGTHHGYGLVVAKSGALMYRIDKSRQTIEQAVLEIRHRHNESTRNELNKEIQQKNENGDTEGARNLKKDYDEKVKKSEKIISDSLIYGVSGEAADGSAPHSGDAEKTLFFGFTDASDFRPTHLNVVEIGSSMKIPFNLLVRSEKVVNDDIKQYEHLIENYSLAHFSSLSALKEKMSERHLEKNTFTLSGERKYFGYFGGPVPSALRNFSQLDRDLRQKACSRRGSQIWEAKDTDSVFHGYTDYQDLNDLAKKHASCIASIVPQSLGSESYIGHDFTLENIVENYHNFAISEFFTHGVLGGSLTCLGESGLSITPKYRGKPEISDYFLTGTKISKLTAPNSLPTNLVLVQACSSAETDPIAVGDRTTSLIDGFLFSGARAVVAAEWQIERNFAIYVSEEITRRFVTSTDVLREMKGSARIAAEALASIQRREMTRACAPNVANNQNEEIWLSDLGKNSGCMTINGGCTNVHPGDPALFGNEWRWGSVVVHGG